MFIAPTTNKGSSVIGIGPYTWCQKWDNTMANLKRPGPKVVGNVSENFELRFNDHCIKANYRDLAKNPVAERVLVTKVLC